MTHAMEGKPPPIDWVKTTLDPASISPPQVEIARIRSGPFVWIPFPELYCNSMGALMFGWAHLDREFHILLTWLVQQYPDAEHQSILSSDSLKKRITLLKKLIRMRFSAEPQAQHYAIELVSAFKQAQAKRNILVHGRLRFRLSAGSPGTLTGHAIVATGRLNGTTQTITLDLNELEDLRYAIASLTGKVRGLLAGKFHPAIDPSEASRVEGYIVQHPPPHSQPQGQRTEASGAKLEVVPLRRDPLTGTMHPAQLPHGQQMPNFSFTGEFSPKDGS